MSQCCSFLNSHTETCLLVTQPVQSSPIKASHCSQQPVFVVVKSLPLAAESYANSNQICRSKHFFAKFVTYSCILSFTLHVV